MSNALDGMKFAAVYDDANVPKQEFKWKISRKSRDT